MEFEIMMAMLGIEERLGRVESILRAKDEHEPSCINYATYRTGRDVWVNPDGQPLCDCWLSREAE